MIERAASAQLRARILIVAQCSAVPWQDGGDDWTAPGWLAQTGTQARGMLAAMRAAAAANASGPLRASWRLWCGECGPHNDNGLANKTDRFLSSFWYADALGGLARLGLAEFGRQALVGGNYELLSRTAGPPGPGLFEPNPDFYVLLVWKRVMGTRVMNVSLAPAAAAATLHAYAHCGDDGDDGNGGGGMGLINISPTEAASVRLALPGGGARPAGTPGAPGAPGVGETAGTRGEWHFAAVAPGAGGLRSHSVALNGRVLAMPAPDRLPSLAPVRADAGAPVAVAPDSVVFVSLPPGARCPV